MEKYQISSEDAVLVIVDIQERLAAVMSERQRVIDNCLHLIELSRHLGMPIILNEQYPKGLGPTVPEIKDVLQECRPLEKITFSCCKGPDFPQRIASTGKKKVILVGMETHVCVLQTCVGLLKDGYMVHAVGDAMCSRTKANYKTGIEYMRDAGAVITGTETILFQLLERAGTEAFKMIAKRIK